MKPPPFEYYNPRSLDEALSHLAEHGYDAKILAGGQSLVPMLNFRLAQPAVLVDLNKIADLAYIQAGNSGGIQVGTMTRHAQVERDPIIAERAPLIHETMPMIATSQIRSRGTFGGSIAHADPSAELVAISVALEGKFRLRSQSGEREVPATDFFLGMFTTQLEPEEILVEASFPSLPPGTGWAIEEIARRPHDFALVGVAVVVTLHSDQRIQNARIVFLSVGDGPVVAEKAAESLRDQAPSPNLLRAAAEIAAAEDIDPSNDIHASADYRRHLAKVLTRQALETAIERAKG
ncbi:MAG: xanthine dehydrogenase family protein subunit M [Chloroflexota bacterium]|nr:MAG: xanthine dehydrogenase family protein subunit M [Chloroflexota bacterium]